MNQSKPLTAFLFGAGAVRNSWTPVVRALNSMNLRTTNPETANLQLSRQIYLLRFYYDSMQRNKRITNNESGVSNSFTNQYQRIEKLKEKIAIELTDATLKCELKPHDEFDTIFKKFVIEPSRRFFTVTTNWDFVIEQRILTLTEGQWSGRNNRIHGDILDPSKLYLPNESFVEPYFDDQRFISNLEIQKEFTTNLSKINRLVCYGISISPLDYELFQALDTAFNPLNNQPNENLSEVIVIVPKRDLELVLSRISAALRSGQSVRLIGYDPCNLDTPLINRVC